MYSRLLSTTPGVTAGDLDLLFKDQSFGAAPGDEARTYSPRAGLRIVRDRSFGVSHVYGATRETAIFGLGYVAAEDRLLFMDVLRHSGRAQLSSFAGGAAGNRAMRCRAHCRSGRTTCTPTTPARAPAGRATGSSTAGGNPGATANQIADGFLGRGELGELHRPL